VPVVVVLALLDLTVLITLLVMGALVLPPLLLGQLFIMVAVAAVP
jgi:hypothetical protein